MTEQQQEDLREALKRVAVALKEAGVPFALIGGYAAWARGGPEPDHDVDFMVAAADATKAAAMLADLGLEILHPPEDWLFKVVTDDSVVDVIFRHSGAPAERQLVESATELEVLSVPMPVLPATDLLVEKMNAMDEHLCDFSLMLPVARSLREQVEWDRVRQETADNHFAAAFLYLLERLSIIRS
jgi:hypothetical protein